MRLGFLALLLAGCTVVGPQAQPPTAAQAQSFMSRVIAVAKSGDFEALCALGGGNCQDYLELEGGRRVPRAEPVVIGGRVIQPTGTDAGRVGGHVLEMCGRTDAGDIYYSEMLVFFDYNGELHGIEPEYWMGIRISEDGIAGQHLNEGVPQKCQGVV